MNVQSQLLFYWEFCQIIKIMVAERKGLADWSNVASTPEGVPLRSAIEGARGLNTRSTKLLMYVWYGLLKPTGNVGQQAKDSALPYYSQAHKMTSVLK